MRLIRRIPGFSNFSIRYLLKRSEYVTSRVSVRAYRFAEKFLGVPFVKVVAWALATGHSLLRADEWSYFRHLHSRLPAPLREGASAGRTYRQMMWSWYAGICVSFLYDRLRLKRWAKRVSLTGFDPFTARKKNQPVIFTFLHSGPYMSSLVWLRSKGHPLSSYIVMPPPFMRDGYGTFLEKGSALYGLSDRPMAYFAGTRKNLIALSRGLKAGAVISMPLDGGAGASNLTVSAGGGNLSLYDGPIRLAISHDALLVPTVMLEKSALHYEISFGQPPPEHLVASGDIQGIADHIVGKIMPVLQENPESLTWTILEAFSHDERRWRRYWP